MSAAVGVLSTTFQDAGAASAVRRGWAVRRAMHRRVALLSARREVEAGTCILRLVRAADPDRAEAEQERCLAAAERAVLADLEAVGRRAAFLSSHVERPGVVSVAGGTVRYLVGVDERNRATILERSP